MSFLQPEVKTILTGYQGTKTVFPSIYGRTSNQFFYSCIEDQPSKCQAQVEIKIRRTPEKQVMLLSFPTHAKHLELKFGWLSKARFHPRYFTCFRFKGKSTWPQNLDCSTRKNINYLFPKAFKGFPSRNIFLFPVKTRVAQSEVKYPTPTFTNFPTPTFQIFRLFNIKGMKLGC